MYQGFCYFVLYFGPPSVIVNHQIKKKLYDKLLTIIFHPFAGGSLLGRLF